MPIPSTGVTSMLKRHTDLLLALLVLFGVLLVLNAGLGNLGVDLDIPLIGG